MGTGSTLIASLVWGTVGFGFFIYGKKQSSMPALAGGALMMVVSYFIESALYLSLVCVAAIVGVWWWNRHMD